MAKFNIIFLSSNVGIQLSLVILVVNCPLYLIPLHHGSIELIYFCVCSQMQQVRNIKGQNVKCLKTWCI